MRLGRLPNRLGYVTGHIVPTVWAPEDVRELLKENVQLPFLQDADHQTHAYATHHDGAGCGSHGVRSL
jgi:predicted NBD/HSP70 family sugar kinase